MDSRDSRDHVQPAGHSSAGHDSAPHDDTPEFTLDDGETARAEQPDLYRLLRGIAEGVVPGPRADFYPQVLKQAGRIRRRRRVLRASSATAVLAAAVVLGPGVAHELRGRGAEPAAAAPAAVVDLVSAYPTATAEPSAAAADVPMAAAAAAPDSRPANALNWPPRGVTPPSQALSLAESYMKERAKPGSTATVTPLWAQVDDDTTVVAEPRGAGDLKGGLNGDLAVDESDTPLAAQDVSQDAHKTWLFVMQAWTADDGGTPSSAVLLVGDYMQSAKSTSMTVYSTPVAFAHARPGSGDDAGDTDQIAELSIWLPSSNRLVVLGAPQTKSVLYAKTGEDLIPQKTVDGVAVFPRTRTLVKGRYDDTVQVRDAKNVALTPPKAWSAADFALTGAGSRWESTSPSAGWAQIPALRGTVPSQVLTPGPTPPRPTPPDWTQVPTQAPTPFVPSSTRPSAKASTS